MNGHFTSVNTLSLFENYIESVTGVHVDLLPVLAVVLVVGIVTYAFRCPLLEGRATRRYR